MSKQRTSEGSEWRPAGRVAAMASAAAAASVGPAHDPDAGWPLERSSSGSQSCQDSVSEAGGSRRSASLLKNLVWGCVPAWAILRIRRVEPDETRATDPSYDSSLHKVRCYAVPSTHTLPDRHRADSGVAVHSRFRFAFVLLLPLSRLPPNGRPSDSATSPHDAQAKYAPSSLDPPRTRPG